MMYIHNGILYSAEQPPYGLADQESSPDGDSAPAASNGIPGHLCTL